jgi:hypothetical protein
MISSMWRNGRLPEASESPAVVAGHREVAGTTNGGSNPPMLTNFERVAEDRRNSRRGEKPLNHFQEDLGSSRDAGCRYRILPRSPIFGNDAHGPGR